MGCETRGVTTESTLYWTQALYANRSCFFRNDFGLKMGTQPIFVSCNIHHTKKILHQYLSIHRYKSLYKKNKKNMSDAFGTPLQDARRMLSGTRPQKTFSFQDMETNCLLQEELLEPGSARIIWNTAIATSVIIILVHFMRWYNSSAGNTGMETVVFLTAVLGVALFLKDVHACRASRGIGMLLLFLLLANFVCPLLFTRDNPNECDENDPTCT